MCISLVCTSPAWATLAVNKKAFQLFGYKPGDLEGKNASCLMPPPFSSHHNQYLLRYKKTGKYGSSTDSPPFRCESFF